MNTVPWDQVRDVVDAVLALEPDQRAVFLSEACPEPAVKHYVESLLAAYDEAGDLLDQPAVFSPANSLIAGEARSWVGRRVGSYQVVAEIGEGGMGAVYRAIRADDQYHQQVAIKVVRSGFPSSFTLGRFRAERQILASLEHPNIARLLDGGAEAGLPYLVMELVEGEPIDRYCDRHRLTVTERLRLFRTACEAVQYAHRRLVVHRDLKPGNILVTSEGAPKLLDFGIAKILDPGSFPQALDPTLTAMRMLTPEYASPEQVRGETITTASDVYSLGVVLYVLLTGRGPYRLKSHAPHELAQAICDTEPERPSEAISRVEKEEGDAYGAPVLETVSSRRSEPRDKLRRRLAGDLDNIVLMALRKEPERRYASVEQLSEDIRRHLEGLPVIAHQDTLGYRSGKFIQRNKLAVTAVLLVVLSLVIGLAATVHEARVARAQRARAERRFNDVRKLANSLIFEVHDSIQTLPGATPVRKLIVDRALQYLDSLATEAHGDVDLQRDLAWAYQRVGLAQGDLFAGNIGDPRGALASIRKASAIWEAIAKTKGATLDDQINNAYGHRVLSNMMSGAGEGDGMEPAREAVAISESLFQIAPTHARVRRELSRDYESLADHEEWLGNYANSLADLRKEYQLCKDALQAKPGDRELLRGFAAVSVKIGTDLAYLGFREQALSINRQGVEIYRSLAKDESDALMRRELAIVLGEQGWIMLMDGQPASALRTFRQSSAMIRTLAVADPQNALLRSDIGGGLEAVGRSLLMEGSLREGLATLERSERVFEQAGTRGTADVAALALNRIAVGEGLARNGRDREAVEKLRWALSTLEPMATPPVGGRPTLAAAHLDLASALSHTGDHAPASVEFHRAIELAQPLARAGNEQARYTVADAYSGLANLLALGGTREDLAQAEDLFGQSLEAWKTVHNPGALSPGRFATGSPQETARASDACKARLAKLSALAVP